MDLSLHDLLLARPPDSKARRTPPGGTTVTQDVTPKAGSMTTRRIHTQLSEKSPFDFSSWLLDNLSSYSDPFIS